MKTKIGLKLCDSVTSCYPEAGYVVFSIAGIDFTKCSAQFYIDINDIANVCLDANNTEKYNEAIEYWKNKYRDMDFPRKKGISSFESLYKRFIKKQSLPRINPFVDLYNAISLKNGICVGAYDADNIEESITLKVVKNEESMLPIGSDEPIAVKNGSVAYYDNKGVICSYWNFRDSERTCISDSTVNIVVTIDTGIDHTVAFNAARELIDVVNKHYICTTTTPLLMSKDNAECVLAIN